MSKIDTEPIRASSKFLVLNPDRPTIFDLATPKKRGVNPSDFAKRFNELNPDLEIKTGEGIRVKFSQLRRVSP